MLHFQGGVAILLLLILCGPLLLQEIDARPANMVGTTSRCNNALQVGDVYMGSTSIESSSKSVTVKRGTTVLSSGDSYVAGETLSVDFEDNGSNNYLLQATGGGSFGGSGTSTCSGTRVVNTAGSLVMPSSGTVTIRMVRHFKFSINLLCLVFNKKKRL